MSNPSCETAPARRARAGLGLIGVGAFGAFCLPHLRRHFRLHLCDPSRDLTPLRDGDDVIADLAEAAAQPVVVLAVPQTRLRQVAATAAPHVQPNALVVDVCSIKAGPLADLVALMPAHADVVATHPLFGPQAGRDGLAGLTVALCGGRGQRHRLVARFLEHALKLRVWKVSAEEHDRQMAFVQGVTHLVGRLVAGLDMPMLQHRTRAFDALMHAVELVRHDSDETFRAVTEANPFAAAVKARLLTAAQRLATPECASGAPLPAIGPGLGLG